LAGNGDRKVARKRQVDPEIRRINCKKYFLTDGLHRPFYGKSNGGSSPPPSGTVTVKPDV
jgi:hypothetical protein